MEFILGYLLVLAGVQLHSRLKHERRIVWRIRQDFRGYIIRRLFLVGQRVEHSYLFSGEMQAALCDFLRLKRKLFKTATNGM